MTILQSMIKDATLMFSGWKLSVLITAVLIFVYILYLLVRRKKIKFGEIFWLAILVFYLITLFELNIFSRAHGSFRSVNMNFLGTWGSSMQSKISMIESILMFIPFGFLFPWLFSWIRPVQVTFLFAFFASVVLEYVQYFTGRGSCELDDVIMNMIGAVVGWCIYRGVSNCRR